MHLARYPNDTLIPLGKVLDPGSIPRNGDFSHRGGKFHFSIDEPNRWAKQKIYGSLAFSVTDMLMMRYKLQTLI